MLFQKNIVRKYLATLPKEQTIEAWNKYQQYFLNPAIQQNILQSNEEQFQEGFLRELFVNVLGYTLNPQPNYNLITEKKNETNSKKADGAILADETGDDTSKHRVIGIIELKDHKTTDLAKIEAQAFGYKSQHVGTRLVIISNFEKLRLYIDNAVEYREWNLFTLTEDEFHELYLCLAWPQVKTGVAMQMKGESVSNEDQITKSLYKDYSEFKHVLFADIVERNPDYDKLLLFKKTQKLLDRLLFIFFAEDCGLLPPNSMMQIIDQWEKLKEMDEYRPFYDRVKKYFGYMNTGFKGQKYEIFAYNGGLFKPDEVLDNIIISDEPLVEHTKRLSTYDFESEVDVNILGHIFENSLSEIEEVTQQIKEATFPSVESKTTSKRKQDGVFYTPQYITKYIVENTVGRLCAEKKSELGIDDIEDIPLKARGHAPLSRPEKERRKSLLAKLDAYRNWLLQITICDPACGSGAFLNAALQFLMNEHRLIDEMEAKVTGASIVFQDVENSILENNLFGVDINEESVEIAQLALWLRTAKPHRKLNTLNQNIKCGNSLISDPAIAGEKAFNWQEQFPRVFREKNKKAWHITTAVHDSRTSNRMIEYKVRDKRDNGTRPYPDPMLLSEEEELIITETIAKIVKEDKLNVLAYNICFDHIHMLLVCEEKELSQIIGKIKSMTARAVNIAMGRTTPASSETRGHAPLSQTDTSFPEEKLSERGHTQCPLWTQKFGKTYIDSEEHLYSTIEYIQNNRQKHGLPPLGNKGACPLVTDTSVPTVSIEEAFRPEFTGGFDVVIGNPPYVQLQSMGKMSDVYAKCGFQTYNKSADLYCLFTERGYSLLKQGGLQSFIMPNKWMLVAYGKELRRFLANTNLKQIVNFGDVQFFEGAATIVCIFVTKKGGTKTDVEALSLNQKTYHGDFLGEVPSQLTIYPFETFGESEWSIRPKAHFDILHKMQKGVALKDMPISINYGIKTGYNDAFFIDGATKDRLVTEDPKSAEIIKPLLRGRDIQAWVPNWGGLYLINTHNGIKEAGLEPVKIDDYPTIKKHLEQFYEKLTKRIDKGVSPYNLRNCDYIKEFSKPKIMYPNMTSVFPFIYDEKGFFGNDKTFMITANDDTVNLKYITAIFNSKLCKLWIWYNCPELLGGTREIRKVHFENFPIPIPTDLNTTLSASKDKGACPLVPNGRCTPELTILADQMLSLNTQLQQKRSRFLRRLQENFEGVKITGTLETFDTLSFADFVKELKKQKIKLTLPQQDEWEDYFGQYKTECNSLSEQIAEIDKKIDGMVYELYGLTEEEIKVVEGI